jgi:phosphoserine phosphatase
MTFPDKRQDCEDFRMTTPAANRWTSFDLIFFDCDSTLSAIEGVDELARLKGKEGRVGLLTQKAMDGYLDLSDVYGKRLRAIRPTRGQLATIEQMYWDQMLPDALDVVRALQFLGKQVFIISGGLAAPVRGFGEKLGVPATHIRAVELEFNELAGEWWKYYEPGAKAEEAYLDFDNGPLTISAGKPQIIEELAGDRWGHRMMVGDGASDLKTKECVDLFVGFGGVVRREKVEAGSDVYVYVDSLAPILVLAAGPEGATQLAGTPYAPIYARGLEMCKLRARVGFNAPGIQAAFNAAFGLPPVESGAPLF